MTNSPKPLLWPLLAILLVALAATVVLTGVLIKKKAGQRTQNPAAAVPPRSGNESDLTGTVTAKGGHSLPVPATVFIETAAPKTGTSTFCPSCYADCSKRARTDGKGHFKIKGLDSQLTFRILAVAPGFQPKYLAKVDPQKGKPVKIVLTPVDSADAAPERSLRGRVVDSKGEPIEGAVVEMRGIETKGGGGRWGGLPGIDPLAVTDDKGEFIITSKDPFEMMSVKVTARMFADKNFNELASGATRHDLAMTEGATLTGRVLLDGKPLAGVSVGVSAVQRGMESDLGHFEIGTGKDGAFAFYNLPPDGDFHLYSLMGTTTNSGSIPLRQIHTGTNGEKTDIGDLTASPGHRLAGRVVLSDGQPVPPKTRLLIGRENTWDSMQVTLDEDGSFDQSGVPSGIISLSLRVNGYHTSGRNLSIDQLNPYRLMGRVDKDIAGLEILLEKGPEPERDYSHFDPDYNQMRERSLRGSEGKPDHSLDWTVSGHVVDSKTQQPIDKFHVTPGQTDQFDQTSWNALRAVDGSNGVYLVYVNKRSTQSLLKVEAEGYLPGSVEVPPNNATNADVVLTKGVGPAGTVTTADGEPVFGATVVLLGEERNQAGFNLDGELTAYGNRSAVHKTDELGNFAFKPAWGMKSVAAASSNGFAFVSLETFATNKRIVLGPFGKITGTLQRASGPGTNENLGVSFAGADAPRLNLWLQSASDAKGHFSFDHVPAGHLQIWARQPVGADNRAWTTEQLEEVDLKPGQSLEVNITAADRVAARSANSFRPPQPKPVPGVEVTGVILAPGGKPAAGADVALQVEGKYLAVGKGVFSSGNLRDEGLIVSTGTDGSFTLPMYEGAQSIVALNEEGYAQVSLRQLKTSPQVTLQKWGRIEGVLRVGHHLGTNQQVILTASQQRWPRMNVRRMGRQTNAPAATNSAPETLQPPMFDFNAFQTRTDGQGHFAITLVPPGEQTIARLVSTGEGSWMHSPLATLTVKPGETTMTNVGGTGRTVIGKIKFADSPGPGFKNAYVMVQTPLSKLMSKASDLKTDEERQAFYQSDEVQAAMKNHRNFSAALRPDGSFEVEDVPPGKYEVNFQQRTMAMQGTTYSMFTSPKECIVPEAKDNDDESIVNWDEVVLEKRNMPIPKMAGGAK